ncbi:hypothetical protein BC938DRAFT_478629 [Jimgerdemannia flammicorona]|uniref:Uncharacterized protein n=1 Tax=Jimgerdemannia flammicorona TaxID=994334 RepID=A0A433P559_9FUNG|nr:hypothetical protein BC938DRAFT_478629 [Jimgerdemannia flammicorona]
MFDEWKFRDLDATNVDERILILKNNNTYPSPNCRMPPDNTRMHPSKILNLRTLHYDTPLQPNAIANNDIGADDDVGPDAAILTDLGGGVDEDVTLVDVIESRVGESLRVTLLQMRQIEAGACQEVLGLPNIHPEALQVERVKFAVVRHEGEDFFFDRSGFGLG